MILQILKEVDFQKEAVFRDGFWNVIDWIYPPFCIGCGLIGYEICDTCKRNIEVLGFDDICDFCNINVRDNKTHRCSNQSNFYMAELKSYGFYSGVLKKIIQEFKFKNRIGIIKSLKHDLQIFFNSWNVKFDLIVPVPLNPKRKKQRGYNQSEILGRHISRIIDIDFDYKGVKRIRNTPSQVGLNHSQRKENVKDAFVAEQNKMKNKSILLVDDIRTTGSTINECAKALKRSGASTIYGFTLARTLIT